MMRFSTPEDWLDWQQTLNAADIDLGLDRVRSVLDTLGHTSKFHCPLITVAGTNGKGSVVAMIEAMAGAMGLTVASYTSPHLLRYNERIRIDAEPISDADLCAAFQRVDDARGDSALTYFEFGTLAAIDHFFQQAPDLVILEVGLGGRLDAANVMDADIAVITTVDIDHVDWLGHDRESIGFEKAGIFRRGQKVIYGDSEPVQSVLHAAEQLECTLYQHGRDFAVETDAETGNWAYISSLGNMEQLTKPGLRGDFQLINAAMSLTALMLLIHEQKLITDGHVLDLRAVPEAVVALADVQVQGRFQKLSSSPDVYVDVAHNPQAARSLQSIISALPVQEHADKQHTWLVLAMLVDKDVETVMQTLAPAVNGWCLCGLPGVDRSLDLKSLVEHAINAGIISNGTELMTGPASETDPDQCTMVDQQLMLCGSVETACRQLQDWAKPEDSIIIAGSFYTVARAMQFFSSTATSRNNDVKGV
jgi:dihydrofolate synthase/folylpolyglutamate synthase